MSAGNLVVNTGTAQGILVDQAGTSDIGVVKIDLSAAGTYGNLWGGTTSVDTVGSILGVRDKIYVATMDSGTVVLNGGTAGTVTGVGSVSSLGSLGMLNAGTVSMLNAGTLTTIPNVPGGTINILAGGTLGILTNGTLSSSGTTTGVGSVSNIGSMAMLNAGTVSMLNAGTLTTIPNIPGGTINILAGGTLGILTNGTLSSSGTTTGVGSVSSLGSLGMLNAGTISMLNAGTLTTIPNIPGGTINILAGGTLGILTNGTLSSVGTATGVGTVTNLGSVTNLGQVYNAGTLQAGTISVGTVYKGVPASQSGSFVAAGTISVNGSMNDSIGWDIGGTWVGTAFFEAQVGTSAWFSVFGLRQQDNALVNSFTGSTGFVGDFQTDAAFTNQRLRFTYSSGTFTYNAQPTFGFDPIIAIEGGTLTNLGSVTNLGQVYNAGTIQAGTLGTVTNLGQLYNAGTVQNQLAGTLTALQNGTITAGSIVQTAGTTSVGTVNTGTINTGTMNAGTINAGTIQLNPLPATNTIAHAGTSGTLGIGTLVTSASIGAGTAAYITRYSLLVLSGTLELTLAFGTQVNGPQVIAHGVFPAGGGIAMPINLAHGFGTTNSALTYQINSGAGTATWDVDYFLHT